MNAQYRAKYLPVLREIIGLHKADQIVLVPEKGQFVGLNAMFSGSVMAMVGYCVHVCAGRGHAGSDQVIICLADGSFHVHENQMYFALTQYQSALARLVFTTVPEEHEYLTPHRFQDGSLHYPHAQKICA